MSDFTYWVRCKEQDAPHIMALGRAIGLFDEDNNPTEKVAIWHIINGNGFIYEPTGETVNDPDTGEEIALTAPKVDEDGDRYWHANLTLPFDLVEYVTGLAAQNPALGEALENRTRFFLGQRPGNPVCVTAGDVAP